MFCGNAFSRQIFYMSCILKIIYKQQQTGVLIQNILFKCKVIYSEIPIIRTNYLYLLIRLLYIRINKLYTMEGFKYFQYYMTNLTDFHMGVKIYL